MTEYRVAYTISAKVPEGSKIRNPRAREARRLHAESPAAAVQNVRDDVEARGCVLHSVSDPRPLKEAV